MMSIKKLSKQSKLLMSARRLFLRHGMKRVTIDEICSSANVSKMTFYKYFQSKLEIAKRVIDEIIREQTQIFEAIMQSQEPFYEKSKRILEQKLRVQREYGDVFLEDILRTGGPLQEFINEKIKGGVKMSLKWLEQGKSEGFVRAELKPEFFTYLMEAITRMAEDERVKAIYPDIHDRLEAVTRFGMYGLFSVSPGETQSH